MMNNWDTDKIIGAGLIVVAITALLGSVVVTLGVGIESSLGECVKDIVIGLAGYMGRGGVDKLRHQQATQTLPIGNDPTPSGTQKVSEALEQVAGVATEAKQVVDAVNAIQNITKK